VHQGSFKFEFEMYQIQSNSIGKVILEIEKTHCCSLLQAAQPAYTLREAQHEKTGSFSRAAC
jgi:hypothetical protein